MQRDSILDEGSKGQPVRCPADKAPDSDIIGCGSTNVLGPDHEGMYDCLNCGIFFKIRS